MNYYELTIVIDSLQKSEDMQDTVNKVQNFVKNNGGDIKHVEDWGKKRLAYEINRKQYGNYHHFFFRGPGNLPKLLERELLLDDSILRFLITKTDQKRFDSVLSEQQEEKEPTKEKPDDKKPAKTDEVLETSDSGDSSEANDETADSSKEEKEDEIKEKTTAS